MIIQSESKDFWKVCNKHGIIADYFQHTYSNIENIYVYNNFAYIYPDEIKI